MNTTELITSLYQIGAIQFGEFTLKSGQTSSIYLNLRKVISYPSILRMIAEAMHAKMQIYSYDLICGVPYTALPIATCLSLSHNIPMVMRRKEKKDYGTKQLIEGVFQANQSCLIIEDVITTGMSVIETAKDLENANIFIQHIVALIDREQGGKENLTPTYQLHTVTTLSEILHTLLDNKILSGVESNIVQEFLLKKSA